MFWGFLIIMVLGGLACRFLFSFWLMPSLLLMAALGKSEKAAKFLAWPVLISASLWQLYFWGMWAAFCSVVARLYALSPQTSHPWIYYVLALADVALPLGHLTSAEAQTEDPGEDMAAFYRGAFSYWLATIVMFGVFCIWPSLMAPLFGWILHIVSVSRRQ